MKLTPKKKTPESKTHRTNHAGSGIAWAWMEIEAVELAREKAGKHGFAVYCALCILESKAGSNHKAKFTGSIQDIMKLTGLGRMSVCNAIKSLRKSELLTVVSGDMKGNSNTYTLHNVRTPGGLPRSAGRTTGVRQADNPSPSGGHQIKGRKESPATQEDSSSSEKGPKGADAGTPPASAGGSDSAPEKKPLMTGTF